MSIYVGEKKAVICKGDYESAALYKGEIKIAGYTEHEYQGTEIAAENTYRAELGLHLYGKSWQETTTGAQLLNWRTIFTNYLDRTVTIENNGYDITISANITAAGSTTSPIYMNVTAYLPDTFAGKTITFSCSNWESNVPQEKNKLGLMYKVDGKTHFYSTATNMLTVTIPENATDIYLRFFLIETASSTVPVGTYTAKYTGVMLNYGDTALPWEPYTGGIPSPNPDYPQPINSIGDSGSVDVVVSDNNGNSQTLTINTPNGLCGIPVDTGGNYIDSTGQQWVCDEVDFERGVYVQRVYQVDIDGENTKFKQAGVYVNLTPSRLPIAVMVGGQRTYAISTFTNLQWFYNPNSQFLYLMADNISDQLNASCKKQLGKVYYALTTPIETPLTEEELTAYKAIKSYPHYTRIESAAELGVKLKEY